MRCVILSLVLLISGCTGLSQKPPVYLDSDLDFLASETLGKFDSEAEFRHYLNNVRQQARQRNYWWAYKPAFQYVQNDAAVNPIECLDEECPEDPADLERVDVTGSRLSSSNPSITNNQNAGVEEGDIVKQIGNFLVILQDGRLFSVHLRPNGNPGLAFTDRIDVYRSENEDTWYDEMLVTDRRIVVTGYSYHESASEVTIIALDEDGNFNREDTFYISSNDYYDTDNYATRIIGNKFVIHSPIYVHDIKSDGKYEWPVVRRWLPEEEHRNETNKARQLFDARDIYRPLQVSLEPIIHTVSICEIGIAESDDNFSCTATAFMAPESYEFYVSETDVFVWTWPSALERASNSRGYWRNCENDVRPTRFNALPSVVFRVTLSDYALTAASALGWPIDQFSIDSNDDEVRALTRWIPEGCGYQRGTYFLSYLQIPLDRFGDRLRPILEEETHDLPPLQSDGGIVNRFTDEYFVYGPEQLTWGYEPLREDSENLKPSRAIALNANYPSRLYFLDIAHGMIRMERAGDDIVLTGYPDGNGLNVSHMDLSRVPSISSTIRLDNRYESEGRSHAFNSVIDADGSGLMGIPTVLRKSEAGRYWWRSSSSNVSFIELNRSKQLTFLGAISSNEDSEHESYTCQVSCIDWYGNSRPIFTDGRVFALSGTELVEGVVVGESIQEIRRVNLTVPLPSQIAP